MLAARCIADLDLSLEGLAVYTEGASGAYVFNPILAAMAGARRVYALTRDSAYASAAEVERSTESAAAAAGVAARIVVTTSRQRDQVADSDVITNSGFVRPIDATMVGWMKPTAVVPLMWETWEFRDSDLDLASCRDRGILVMGTDEGKPPFPMYRYVGLLALKLLFELGLEGLRTSVLVLGGGRMGEAVAGVLAENGAAVTSVSGAEDYARLGGREREVGVRHDAIVCAEHEDPRMLIGPGGVFTAGELAAANPALRVGVISGNVDQRDLQAADLRFFPSQLRPFGFMTYLPSSLGPRPVMELFASGLKVGWAMASARRQGLSGAAAERYALGKSPAMAFARAESR